MSGLYATYINISFIMPSPKVENNNSNLITWRSYKILVEKKEDLEDISPKQYRNYNNT